MTIRKNKMAALIMAVTGMALFLAGCRVNINTGPFGLSDLSYADSEQYTVGAAELSETVEHIDIHWPVGSVTVKPHGSDTVSFSEESDKELTDDALLRYWLDGATLHIQFCQAGKWRLDEMEKDLTVLVPEGLVLADVEVNSISADVCMDGLRTDRLSVDTTSGGMRLTGCAVTELVSADTVSGRLEAELVQPLKEFSGDSTSGTIKVTAPAIEDFSSDSVSGSVNLSVKEAPKSLDIQTTSGSINLALPEDAAFTLDYDATSGKLFSDLSHSMESGRYIFGDGTGEYVINTTSGNVRITAVK